MENCPDCIYAKEIETVTDVKHAVDISMLSLSAKSVKEGSLRIKLFTLIPTVVGGASMYMVLKAIFINAVNTTHLLIIVLSTALYGVAFLLVGYWLINSEKVLNK